jgi:glycosyltransferase involved in cell wall biosynthesis
MKVARRKVISITHYTGLYGANRSLLNLIEGTRSELEWIVVCKGTANNSGDVRLELLKLNVKCFTVPFRIDVSENSKLVFTSKLLFFAEGCFNFLLALSVSIYARIKGISFIHTNSSATCFGAYIAFLSSLPHIWHFREFLNRDYGLTYKFGIRFLAYWANHAVKIVSISHSIDKACIKERGIHVPSYVIFNGVVFEREMQRLCAKKFGTAIKLVIVGVIDSAKDQMEAIKAVHLLALKGHHVILDVLGATTGVYYEALALYVKDNNLSDVIKFKGYVADVKLIFSEADIAIMCSKNEAMGRVTIESMAYGAPVVGYDEAGTSELIENGATGILYTGNEVDLAAAIETLFVDKKLYNRIRNNAHELVKNKYTVEIYASNFMRAIDELSWSSGGKSS